MNAVNADASSSPTRTGPNNNGLRVLHVAETAQGGVGSYIEEVVSWQAELYGTDNVRVVMPREHAQHFKKLPPATLHTFDIGTGAAGRLRTMLRMTAVALQQVRQWQPHIVHLHSTYAGFALRPLLALLPHGARVVYCAHGWAFDREGPALLNRVLGTVEQLWSRWSDAVICISQHDLDSARRVGMADDRLVVVMNGIADVDINVAADADSDASLPVDLWRGAGPRILFVGRLDRQKGVDLFFDAMHRLGDRASAVVIGSAVVAGQSGPTPPPNVRVLGWLPRDRLAAHYRAAQVLVVPSRWEGFGLVALEAMRAGRAVVGSRVGGLPEVVDHGTTGWLLDLRDESRAGAALATRLETLSDATLCEMGEAGRQRYERLFNVRRVGQELDTLYHQLLHAATPRGLPTHSP